MSDIVAKQLSKSFGDEVVFKDLSIRFQEGKTTCLMGPSGCGKTTLLRIIAGLEQADQGEIISDAKRISFVFQEDRLSEDFSAISNIRFVVGKSIPLKQITEMLEAFELGDSMHKPVRELSGGMKRRVAIARALCAPYDLLILDEPLKGLDEKRKMAVMETMKASAKGKTVICVTHDQAEADALGDHVIQWEEQ